MRSAPASIPATIEATFAAAHSPFSQISGHPPLFATPFIDYLRSGSRLKRWIIVWPLWRMAQDGGPMCLQLSRASAGQAPSAPSGARSGGANPDEFLDESPSMIGAEDVPQVHDDVSPVGSTGPAGTG